MRLVGLVQLFDKQRLEAHHMDAFILKISSIFSYAILRCAEVYPGIYLESTIHPVGSFFQGHHQRPRPGSDGSGLHVQTILISRTPVKNVEEGYRCLTKLGERGLLLQPCQ